MKRIISVLICVALLFSTLCFTVFAENDKKSETDDLIVSVSDVTGNPGDTVYAFVSLNGNMSISNIAFSLVFDKSVLKYKDFYAFVFDNYTVYDHSGKGRIAVASISEDNISVSGNIACFEFKIKKKAKVGDYKFKLCKTYFASKKGKKVAAKITDGSLTITEPCSEEHVYDDYVSVIDCTCVQDGIRFHRCLKCGHTEVENLKKTGHTPEKRFSFDIIAKDSKPGMLSRHCTTCGTKTSVIVYTEKSTAALNINSLIDTLDDASIGNLVYFLNGFKNYPDVPADVNEVPSEVKDKTPVKNSDGTINASQFFDRLLSRAYGSDKSSGFIGSLKRAAIAGELPLSLFNKLICLLFA